MKPYRIVLPLLTACLALSACAGQGGDTTQDSGAAPDRTGVPVPTVSNGPGDQPGAPATAAPPPSETSLPTPGSSGRSSAAGGTTLSGTITAGVEPGCLLLGEHLLVGGPTETLRAGARVTVTGQVRADLMTTCQQGIPFLVETAAPA